MGWQVHGNVWFVVDFVPFNFGVCMSFVAMALAGLWLFRLIEVVLSFLSYLAVSGVCGFLSLHVTLAGVCCIFHFTRTRMNRCS